MNSGGSGRIAVMVMLLGVVAYLGLLLLFMEPTPWRDLPAEGVSRNGIAFDATVAELRIYRMPARRYPFYFEDELAPVQPLLRAGDPVLIERLLAALRPPRAGEPSLCMAAKPESGLHVVTYRGDGSIFGYVVVFEAQPTPDAPAGTAGCNTVMAAGAGGRSTWYVQGFADALREQGVPL